MYETNDGSPSTELLQHVFDECVGNWRLRDIDNQKMMQCDRCFRTFPATDENRLAAIDENLAGIHGVRGQFEGLPLIDAPMTPWNPWSKELNH